MAAFRFTTTRLAGLHPVGRAADLQHSIISAVLQQRLGEAYGKMFADYEVRDSDTRDWFVDSAISPIPFSELTLEGQEALRAKTLEMVSKVLDLAEKLESESSNGKNIGRVLREAVNFPPADLWSTEDNPLIVNWGYQRVGLDLVQPRSILGMGSPATSARETSSPTRPPAHASDQISSDSEVREKRSLLKSGVSSIFLSSFIWLLFIAIMLRVELLLLPACGVQGFLGKSRWLTNCPHLNAAAAAQADGRRLQRELEKAEVASAVRHQNCAIEGALVDRTNKEAVQRLSPEDPHGDFEISLVWDGDSDLDLIVECPDGSKLWRGALVACGARLKQDVNVGASTLTSSPIEHAAWNIRPSPGEYRVNVELYSYNNAERRQITPSIPFRLLVKNGPENRILKSGILRGERNSVLITTVRVD